jgi:hypothetical protein
MNDYVIEMQVDGKLVLSPARAARKLGVNYRTFLKLLKSGQFKTVTLGRRVYVLTNSLPGGSLEEISKALAAALRLADAAMEGKCQNK